MKKQREIVKGPKERHVWVLSEAKTHNSGSALPQVERKRHRGGTMAAASWSARDGGTPHVRKHGKHAGSQAT